MAIDMRAIGLRPREMQVLKAAVWARGHVSNGHYLTSSGQKMAGERMINRGFLTRVDEQFTPQVDWLVVKITKQNWQALEAAKEAAKQVSSAVHR